MCFRIFDLLAAVKSVVVLGEVFKLREVGFKKLVAEDDVVVQDGCNKEEEHFEL